MEREAAYGKSGFTLQFMLDTSLSDAERYPLKLMDFSVLHVGESKAPISIQYGAGHKQLLDKVASVGFAGDKWYAPLWHDPEKWEDYEGVILAVDPSGRGQDQTGYAIIAHLMGNLFLLDAGGLKGGYDKTTLVTLANKAKRYKVTEVVVEANFGKPLPNKNQSNSVKLPRGQYRAKPVRERVETIMYTQAGGNGWYPYG
jgi:hypothetical protein